MLGNVALNYYIMTLIKLTCIACTKSTNSGFILKLQNKEDQVAVSAFGTTVQKKQQTYYMKVGASTVPAPGNKTRPVLGVVADLDLDNYTVTEMPYVLPESAENAGETVQLKWLFL